MLLYLAVDYARDPELRRRFADNPQEVLREYLSDEQRAGWEASGRGDVERALHDGVDELIRTLDTHRELALLPDMLLWAAPSQPQVKKVSPDQVKAGQAVSLTVSGKDFAQAVSVRFDAPGKKGALMSGPTVNAGGTQITGSVTFEAPGTYTCAVSNNPGTAAASTGTLAQAITAT